MTVKCASPLKYKKASDMTMHQQFALVSLQALLTNLNPASDLRKIDSRRYYSERALLMADEMCLAYETRQERGESTEKHIPFVPVNAEEI